MEKQIYKGNISPDPQLSATLREAAFFLQNIENTKKRWKGLTYPEVFNLVKNFVQTINPELDLEKVSVENIIKHLSEVLAQKENLESVVPQNLQELINELEKAEGRAKIFEQKAAQKVQELIERNRLFAERKQQQKPFAKAAEELTSSVAQKLSQGLPFDKQEQIVEEIIKEIGVQTEPELSLKKISGLPPEEKQKEEPKIATQIQNSFNEALSSALVNLRQKGTTFTPEEVVLLQAAPSSEDLPFLARQLTLPVSQKNELSFWLREQFSAAATPQEAQNITILLTPIVAEKLPEVDQNTLGKLTESQFAGIKAQVEEAVVAALVEAAPETGEISPKKISRIISTLVPQNKDELIKYSPISTTPKENRIIISSSLQTEPIEVTQLPTKFPRFFTSPIRRASEGNILHVKNNQGIRFVDEIRAKLLREGITKENTLVFRNAILQRWALHLTAQKITPEDLDYTAERLIKAGEAETSPRIRELQETKLALATLQEKLPSSLLEKIKKEGQDEKQKSNLIVEMPSRFKTAIIRKPVDSQKITIGTKINYFFGKLLGKENLITSSGQIIQINKLSLFTHRLSEKIKTWFFKTSFGQGIKKGLLQIGQKSLQTLWTGAKIGIKKGVTAILAKVGLHAIAGVVSAGIGNVLIAVIPKLFKWGSSLIKKTVGGITSAFGLFDSILGNITGQKQTEEDKSMAWLYKGLLLVIIGVFVGLPFLIFFTGTLVTGGAFVQPASGGSGGAVPAPAPPQCTPSRYLAEEVICTLNQCGVYKVTTDTLFRTRTCINNSGLQGKGILVDELSKLADGTLQCIGFVDAVQKALGQSMGERRHACTYAVDIPTNYTKIIYNKDYTESPWKKGDIAVWLTPYCGGEVKPGIAHNLGHIAIVIEDWENSGRRKITVAETNGLNGEMRVVSYAVDNPNDNHSPTVFLRYNR